MDGRSPATDGPAGAGGSGRAPSIGSRPSGEDRLEVRPGAVLAGLLALVAVLAALSASGQLAVYLLPDFPLRDGIAHLVWMDHEQSLPTLFAVLQLVAAAAIAGRVSVLVHQRGLDRPRSWQAFTAVLVLLCLDEFLALHERLVDPVRDALDLTGPLYYAWVVPGAAAVLVVAAAFGRWVLSLPGEIRNLVVLSGAMFVLGALALEVAASAYVVGDDGRPPDTADPFWQGLGYLPMSLAEEVLEKSSISVLIYALLRHIKEHLGGLQLNLALVPATLEGAAPEEAERR